MNNRAERTTVGDIVATDFRAAGVFEKFGIDFCCGGRRSLDEACRSASADPDVVLRALDELTPAGGSADEATTWPLGRLIDHIVTTHHGYVRTSTPLIARYLNKLVEVHGVRHPELERVANHFATVGGELTQHMMKEEHVLFPYIRELGESAERSCGRVMSPFGTVENPIRMMEREHREAADELQAIRELTNNYTAPDDGCTTYRVCMAELDRFEHDLHRHVHLENNVLFPRAIALESGSDDRG